MLRMLLSYTGLTSHTVWKPCHIYRDLVPYHDQYFKCILVMCINENHLRFYHIYNCQGPICLHTFQMVQPLWAQCHVIMTALGKLDSLFKLDFRGVICNYTFGLGNYSLFKWQLLRRFVRVNLLWIYSCCSFVTKCN